VVCLTLKVSLFFPLHFTAEPAYWPKSPRHSFALIFWKRLGGGNKAFRFSRARKKAKGRWMAPGGWATELLDVGT